MQRDIPAQYLLRLGQGEQELDTEAIFSRHGRVQNMLARRLELLAKVCELFVSQNSQCSTTNCRVIWIPTSFCILTARIDLTSKFLTLTSRNYIELQLLLESKKIHAFQDCTVPSGVHLHPDHRPCAHTEICLALALFLRCPVFLCRWR